MNVLSKVADSFMGWKNKGKGNNQKTCWSILGNAFDNESMRLNYQALYIAFLSDKRNCKKYEEELTDILENNTKEILDIIFKILNLKAGRLPDDEDLALMEKMNSLKLEMPSILWEIDLDPQKGVKQLNDKNLQNLAEIYECLSNCRNAIRKLLAPDYREGAGKSGRISVGWDLF